MTDTSLSKALSVPRSTVSKWRSEGMPAKSVDLARQWMLANRPHRGQPTRPDINPLIYPNSANPADLPDDPYSVRDRLRQSEKAKRCSPFWRNSKLITCIRVWHHSGKKGFASAVAKYPVLSGPTYASIAL
jgi:hypothetical protein